jgi:hypothetical protein
MPLLRANADADPAGREADAFPADGKKTITAIKIIKETNIFLINSPFLFPII